MQTTDILHKLEGVSSHGNGFTALCPGHDDHDPSLSITEVDGKILLKCFAGCELGDILKPLNLKASDLFSDGGGIHPSFKGVNPSTHLTITFRKG